MDKEKLQVMVSASLKTMDHLIAKFERMPDRKGALQDIKNERTRLQLEYELNR